MQKLNLLYLTAPEAKMKQQLNLYTGNAFSFYRDNIIPGSLLVVRINNSNLETKLYMQEISLTLILRLKVQENCPNCLLVIQTKRDIFIRCPSLS